MKKLDILSIALTTMLSAQAASALDRSVQIVNESFDTIWSVHISHIDDDGWRGDLLGRNVIPVGYSMRVQPRRAQGYCRFDVRIDYANGAESEIFWDMNLCEIRTIFVDGSGYHSARY